MNLNKIRQLHEHLSLCKFTERMAGWYYMCECGRVAYYGGAKEFVITEMRQDLVISFRKNEHWRIFKRMCAAYGIDHKEYMDI